MSKKRSPWIDISVPLYNGMVHWPGDPEVKIKVIQDLNKGDHCTVRHLSMGSHTGTHMDAPSHFIKGGKNIDEIPFDAVIGPARVLPIKSSVSITVQELRNLNIRSGDRCLFKTRNSKKNWKTKKFIKDFVYISEPAAEYLASKKVRMVGVDYLSAGGFSADGPAIHQKLLGAGIWIVEGLNLEKVVPGKYEVICLPLRILKGDGAPARAIIKLS